MQHGFTMVPERDASGRLTGTHTLRASSEGRVGQRYPGLKKGCSDDEWVRERCRWRWWPVGEGTAQRNGRGLAAAVAAVVAAALSVVFTRTTPPGPPVAGVSSHVLTDAAQTASPDTGWRVLSRLRRLGGHWHGCRSVPPSVVGSSGNPGQVFLANGRWRRTVGQEPLEDGRVDSGGFRDDHRGDWLGCGHRMENGVLVMVPSRLAGVCDDDGQRMRLYAGGVDEPSWSGEGIEPCERPGGGSLMVVEVTLPSGAKALSMFGTLMIRHLQRVMIAP